jgi:hypothetical protein
MKRIIEAVNPPKKDIDLTAWSDEDLRTLATIQEKCKCHTPFYDTNLLDENDLKTLDFLFSKYNIKTENDGH